MIKFTLKCDRDHRFDSWFQSTDAYDKLQRSGLVTCAVCGSEQVDKALMTPRVQEARKQVPAPVAASQPTPPPDITAQALAEIRKEVEANSEYVGLNFVQEARDMHDGLTPGRAIYGEARADEAKKLIDDGVPVAPLPFIPGRKSN